MKKSDKKIENAIISSLTEVCDTAKAELKGFDWLTHTLNFNDFPQSLKIVCVFETNDDLSDALQANQDILLLTRIKQALSVSGIVLKNINKHVSFDTEEACLNEHQGQWDTRLNAPKSEKFIQNNPHHKLH